MRRLLRFLLLKPVLWATRRFDSNPDKPRIYEALTKLYHSIFSGNEKLGPVLHFNSLTDRYIIFSDQHKGARNGADDFGMAAATYLDALRYYHQAGFTFINLGDCEELWENTLGQVKKNNVAQFEAEKLFVHKDAFIKIIGNHDLYWANDPLAGLELENMYGKKIKAYEGVVLQTTINQQPLQIFCTHGHQGDANSDGNWFTKFFISRIWGPLQSYLSINPNEPSNDVFKKTIHNEIMYQWSAEQQQTLLITGHTHQPVFQSLTHIERLYRQMDLARTQNDSATMEKIKSETLSYQKRFDSFSLDYAKILPTYFNTGCCCFADGDITGIEIESGNIRLIKWKMTAAGAERMLLEEDALENIMMAIQPISQSIT